MTNEKWIATLAHSFLEQLENGKMAALLLKAARSPINDSGEMYSLWCDDMGCCGDGEQMCSDEAQLDCIQRYLNRQHESL